MANYFLSFEVSKCLRDSYHYPPAFLDVRTDRNTRVVMYSALLKVFRGSGQILTPSCSSSERREKLTGFYLTHCDMTSSGMSFSIKHEWKCETLPDQQRISSVFLINSYDQLITFPFLF